MATAMAMARPPLLSRETTASYKTAPTFSTPTNEGVLTLVPDGDAHIGPPPPSPPASVDREDVDAKSTVSEGVATFQQGSSKILMESRTLKPLITSSPMAEFPVPQEGLLHAEPEPMSRPTRRNTTGSTPSTPKRRFTSPWKKAGVAYDDTTIGDGGVELDIELHADQIRRERMSKRAKQQQQEAEATLTRQGSKASRASQSDKPLVGNLIGEDHVNYVLMYNMLTGIRVGVGSHPSHATSLC
jgi:1-phosphatidylinositol-4-phosphate 5-kinase